MFRPRVIPCLLIKGNGLYKTINFKNPKYLGDPINTVSIFNEKCVDELIFLDITATNDNKNPNIELIKKLASESFMPVGYGGGITTVDQVKEILNIGIEKVIINTAAIKNPDFVNKASQFAGSQSIVVSIDIKKNFFGNYIVYTNAGTVNTKKNPLDVAKQMVAAGAGELIINSIDNDGMMNGYDIKLTRQIADNVDVPVVSCGGAADLVDLQKVVREGHASAVAAGSMFVYYGPHKAVLITYPTEEQLEYLFIDKEYING